MFSSTAINTNALPPLILLYMPPLLRAKAKAIAAQEPLVHPIWRKFEQRGNHFVARTNDLKYIEEVADWAKSWLIEPEEPINRRMRQAFKKVIERTHRYVFFQQIGKYNVIAQGWK
jgi:hypothetical protein